MAHPGGAGGRRAERPPGVGGGRGGRPAGGRTPATMPSCGRRWRGSGHERHADRLAAGLLRRRLHRLDRRDGGAGPGRRPHGAVPRTADAGAARRGSPACRPSASPGRAGRCRPTQMEAALPPVFEALGRSGRRSSTTRCARRSTPRPRSAASAGRSTSGSASSAPVRAAGRRRPDPGAVLRLRQPVRHGRRRDVPARPPPDDEPPPGHADGRGRPAAAPGAADGPGDRPDGRPRT